MFEGIENNAIQGMYRLRGGARREDAVLKGISFSEG
jgi:hypothetical protein